MPHNPNEQAELDAIQVEYVDLNHMHYRWAAPHYPEERRIKVNAMYDAWSVFLQHENNRNTAAGKNKRITSVYRHMIENGMKNPIIVKPHSYTPGWAKNCYYVVVGNQRLAILRAILNDENQERRIELMKGILRYCAESLVEIEQTGKILIPCFIAREQDNWEDHTFAVKKYIRFDPAQQGWR